MTFFMTKEIFQRLEHIQPFTIVLLEMHASDKIFGKICLKVIIVSFFLISGVLSGDRVFNFLWG